MYDYGKPSEYPKWLIEDIQDTIEDMELEPGITPDEMRATAKEYYNRAQWMYDEVNCLESQAEILERIARDEEEYGVKWID